MGFERCVFSFLGIGRVVFSFVALFHVFFYLVECIIASAYMEFKTIVDFSFCAHSNGIMVE